MLKYRFKLFSGEFHSSYCHEFEKGFVFCVCIMTSWLDIMTLQNLKLTLPDDVMSSCKHTSDNISFKLNNPNTFSPESLRFNRVGTRLACIGKRYTAQRRRVYTVNPNNARVHVFKEAQINCLSSNGNNNNVNCFHSINRRNTIVYDAKLWFKW